MLRNSKGVGLLIKRARMGERRQPSKGEKIEVRRWNKRISK